MGGEAGLPVEWIGFAAATATTLAFLPQLLKVLATGRVEDLSVGMLMLQSGGCGLWFVYALSRWDLPLMLANGFTATMVAAILVMKIWPRRRGAICPPEAMADPAP